MGDPGARLLLRKAPEGPQGQTPGAGVPERSSVRRALNGPRGNRQMTSSLSLFLFYETNHMNPTSNEDRPLLAAAGAHSPPPSPWGTPPPFSLQPARPPVQPAGAGPPRRRQLRPPP